MHAKIHDRTGQPVLFDLWVKPQTSGFHEFILLFSILLQTDRLQLTAVYCDRRVCKDNTSKDPFSQCEELQGIHIQLKNEYVGMTQCRTTSTKTCLMWPQTWIMCTLTRTTTEDSWVPFVRSSVMSLLSCYCCYCFLCQSMISCAHTVAQICALFVSSSSPCFMRTLSDSLFGLPI